MRITNQMMVNHAIQRISDNVETISKLQDKVSTEKRFQNASEDPARASVSLGLHSHLRALDTYSQVATSTQDWMLASDSAFDQMEQIALQANQTDSPRSQ